MTADADAPPLLSVQRLNAWYGESHALQGVDLSVRKGEVVTLLGRNGAGKSTLLRCIMGLLSRCSGSIQLGGKSVLGLAPERIAALGVGYCPEERGIFATLNVRENLLLPPKVDETGLPLSRIFELFPNIEPRLRTPGTKLSGGEQQMLAIARILRTGARLLLLDEPTEGLAPAIVQRIGTVLNALRDAAYTIVLVEQNLAFAVRSGDRHYVLEGGRLVDSLTRSEVAQRRHQLHRYLGV